MKNNNPNPGYFHCYATANNSRLYLKDLKNLYRINKFNPGVYNVSLLIAISEVHNLNLFDKLFVQLAKVIFRKHRSVRLVDIFFKTNSGRDFSSYQMLLNKVRTISKDEDYIFFQNRSGYGPFRHEWYKNFIVQFEKFDSVALCGSTINFMDHPTRSMRNDLPHIQTYSFLSRMNYMNMLGEKFPGAKEMERSNIIINGEIGLSQFFLEKGFKIACMEWPDKAITNDSQALNDTDLKENVSAHHYFYHRKYFKNKK